MSLSFIQKTGANTTADHRTIRPRAAWLLCLCCLACALAPAQWVPPGSPTLDYSWKGGDEICEFMFIGLFRSISPGPAKPTNMILDKSGNVVWWQKGTTAMLDFKVHPDGRMSYQNAGDWIIMDTAFNVVDTLRCTGLTTDVHDLLITDDGHYFLICNEDTTMDLRGLYTQGGAQGDSAGTVTASVIRELDAQRNLVREWRSIAHFDLADSDTVFFQVPHRLQLNHTNAIFLDDAGNMLVSHRYNHELTYIDWATGDIIWRLGGPNNEFTFTNDVPFNSQHFGQVLPDGRISVFDNGTHREPRRARGVIYALDTLAMTATKVWEFADTVMISSAYGSFQALPNGDGLVDFGAFFPNSRPNVVYVRADSTVVLEIKIQDVYWTYRAQCLDLPFSLPRPVLTCYEQNGRYYLAADSAYGEYIWHNYETASSVEVRDTGDYQVFVRHGAGWLGSEVWHVTDTAAPCIPVATPEPAVPAGRKPNLTGVYDVLGREAGKREKGKLYFEVYEDGSVRRVMER